MPVRVKQRALGHANQQVTLKDWEELRKAVASILLAWPKNISVTILDISSGQKIRFTAKNASNAYIEESDYSKHVCNMLSQAGYISTPESCSWVPISASASRISIQGAISLKPAPMKHIQFISLGIHPLSSRGGHNVLFEEINRLFSNSSFGNLEDSVELDEAERKRRAKDRRYKSDMFTNKELRGVRKGIDRWPMFSFNIEVSGPVVGTNMKVADALNDSDTLLSSIVDLLRVVTAEFLRGHHFSAPSFHCKDQGLKSDRNESTYQFETSQSLTSADGM